MVACQDVHLTPAQRRIVDFLQEHADGGACSKVRLAQEVGCSVKTVDRAIAHLRHEGVVVAEARFAESGAQLANVYRLVD